MTNGMCVIVASLTVADDHTYGTRKQAPTTSADITDVLQLSEDDTPPQTNPVSADSDKHVASLERMAKDPQLELRRVKWQVSRLFT